jgi:hypothetical protein
MVRGGNEQGENWEAIRMKTEKNWGNKCARLRMKIEKTRMNEDMRSHNKSDGRW